jgi:hypothetical protein
VNGPRGRLSENPRDGVKTCGTHAIPRARRPERQLPRRLAVKVRDLVLSAAAFAVLIALITLADDRVRERIGGVSARSVSHRVIEGTAQVESATIAAREVVLEKGALTVLVVAGGVLFVCMLRT